MATTAQPARPVIPPWVPAVYHETVVLAYQAGFRLLPMGEIAQKGDRGWVAYNTTSDVDQLRQAIEDLKNGTFGWAASGGYSAGQVLTGAPVLLFRKGHLMPIVEADVTTAGVGPVTARSEADRMVDFFFPKSKK